MSPSHNHIQTVDGVPVSSSNPLGLKLPNRIEGQIHATVSPTSNFHWLLDESHSSILRQAHCERAWYLASGLERAIDVHEVAILKSLSTYGGAFGTVVHDIIRRTLDAHREILAVDGRALTESRAHDFDRGVAAGVERLSHMIVDSWRESFPNGKASRDHPRFVEHIKAKHQIDQQRGAMPPSVPQAYPNPSTVDGLKDQLKETAVRWRDLFYLDLGDVFRDDPRGLIPPGGLRNIDPALVIEAEEKSISYLKQDTFELLAQGALSLPFYELDVAIPNAPVSVLQKAGVPGRFQFRIRDVIDFVYLTFTQKGEPRLVAMDWKTNSLDEHTGAPSYATQQAHLAQLKHHAVYLLQRYQDIFQRYDKEILLAFQRAGKHKPDLPRQLSPEMVFVGDVYLSAGDLGAQYRFKPKCAADLDLDIFIADLRERLTQKVQKFISVDPVETHLERWAPTGLKTNQCDGCTQAPLCPDVSREIRNEWPASVGALLERLVLPARDATNNSSR